jgi:hypothetical protein
MNPEEILLVADVERARLASELSDWWLEKHYLFANSKAGKNYARLGKGLSKEFYEENSSSGEVYGEAFSGYFMG